MPKDKYDTPNPQRKHTYMSMEDIVAGKKSSWYELEITGNYRLGKLHLKHSDDPVTRSLI